MAAKLTDLSVVYGISEHMLCTVLFYSQVHVFSFLSVPVKGLLLMGYSECQVNSAGRGLPWAIMAGKGIFNQDYSNFRSI